PRRMVSQRVEVRPAETPMMCFLETELRNPTTLGGPRLAGERPSEPVRAMAGSRRAAAARKHLGWDAPRATLVPELRPGNPSAPPAPNRARSTVGRSPPGTGGQDNRRLRPRGRAARRAGP